MSEHSSDPSSNKTWVCMMCGRVIPEVVAGDVHAEAHSEMCPRRLRAEKQAERAAAGEEIADPPAKAISVIPEVLALSAPITTRRLPAERQGFTHKFNIAGHEGYLTVGLYDDGTVGEIFLRMAKQGSTVAGFSDSFAIATSMLLQRGTPLQAIIDKFKGVRFEPSGFTETPGIRRAHSPVDYVARYLELRFVLGKDVNEEEAGA